MYYFSYSVLDDLVHSSKIPKHNAIVCINSWHREIARL